MKPLSKITLIALNSQGASIEYKGKSKAEAIRKFKVEYSIRGWKLKYYDTCGNLV